MQNSHPVTRSLGNFLIPTQPLTLVTLLLLVAMLPSLHTLPWPLLSGFILIVLAKFIIPEPWQHAGKAKFSLSVVLLILWAIFIYFAKVRWLSGETFLSALLLIVALKWLEARSRAEGKFLSLIAGILLAISSLYLSGVPALLFLLLGHLLVIYTLWALNQPVSLQAEAAVSLKKSSANIKRGFNLCTFILLVSLPFVSVLFLAVPRIQGPLWEIGVVMGLPLELMVNQNNRQQAGSVQLRSGNVSRAKGIDEPVLVADFVSAVPSKSRLYWRGPIYDAFDGKDWLSTAPTDRNSLLKKSFKRRSQLDKALTKVTDLVTYEARITTQDERWLYGLDLPYGSSAETFISEDFQVLRLNKRDSEFNYLLSAYLEYRGGRPLTAEQLQQYTDLPKKGTIKLRRWSSELFASSESTKDFVFTLSQALARSGFQFDADVKAPLIEGLVDYEQLFFEKKRGSIEQLNAIVAYILRAAGIPARIVTGYRGGNLIALTNFIVVKQTHAHVWLELWIADSGWQRLEIKDLLELTNPDKKPSSGANVKVTAVNKTLQKSASAASPAPKTSNSNTKGSTEKTSKTDTDNPLLWLATLSKQLKNWVMNYSPEQQVEILQKAGIKQVNWKLLLLISVLAVGTLIVLFSALWSFKRKPRDAIADQFLKFNKFLTGHHLACAPHECPQRWLQRLERANPECLPALRIIIQRYIKIRYFNEDQQQIKQDFKILKRDMQRFKGMM